MQLTNTNSDSNRLDIENTGSNVINNTGNDTFDYASETNDIDIELTADTNDATLDTIDNISDDINLADTQVDTTGPIPDSPTISDDIYHFIEQRLLSLDSHSTMALGTLTYHEDFHPHYFPPEKEGGFGKTLYKTSPASDKSNADSEELGLVFFGEVCPSAFGTAISAKGNHYAGTPENPKVRTSQFDNHQ